MEYPAVVAVIGKGAGQSAQHIQVGGHGTERPKYPVFMAYFRLVFCQKNSGETVCDNIHRAL